MESKLKPCPFCGGDVDPNQDSITCSKCKSVFDFDAYSDVELWNSRHAENILKKQIEDLSNALQRIISLKATLHSENNNPFGASFFSNDYWYLRADEVKGIAMKALREVENGN